MNVSNIISTIKMVKVRKFIELYNLPEINNLNHNSMIIISYF